MTQTDVISTQSCNKELFLHQLSTNAKDLVEGLVKQIRLGLQQYDDNHFEIARNIRFILYQREKKLKAILTAEIKDKEWQVRYAQLCGLLRAMLEQLNSQSENIDTEFSDLLHQLIATIHVYDENDLPDDLKTGQSCQQHFAALCDTNPNIFQLKLSDLETVEQNEFESKISKLLEGLQNKDDPISKQIRATVTAVHEEINDQCDQFKLNKPKKFKPEFAKYTKVLNIAASFIDQPIRGDVLDSIRIIRLRGMADLVNDQPSPPKKVVGAMLGLVAVAMIAMGIAVAVSVITPFSALALVIGTALMWKVSSLTVCGSAAIVSTLGSVGLFSSSMRYGASKEIKKLSNILAKENSEASRRRTYSGYIGSL